MNNEEKREYMKNLYSEFLATLESEEERESFIDQFMPYCFMTVSQMANMLHEHGAKKASRYYVYKLIEKGLPVNDDKTINLLTTIAWLLDKREKQAK